MKTPFLVIAVLWLLVIGLHANPPNPRTWYFLLINADGTPLTEDLDGLQFVSTLKGVTRDDKFPGFGFLYANGNAYARVQLGNFGVDWVPSDTLKITITRYGNPGVRARVILPIPDGTSSIWWGQPITNGKEYPGVPVMLVPYMLKVTASNKAIYDVYLDGVKNGYQTGQTILPNNVDSLTGVYSLEPAPQGLHWEPAQHTVSLEDFRLQTAATTSEESKSTTFYSHSIEFKLVKDNDHNQDFAD